MGGNMTLEPGAFDKALDQEDKFFEEKEEKTASERILQFFSRDLRDEAEEVYDMCSLYLDVAKKLTEELPRSPERTVALRKLLESQDAALRAFKEK
jgi:hypothetical protein